MRSATISHITTWNIFKTFAIDLGSQDLDHGSSKFEFGSMGHSLSPLHTSGKFPEINNNYLPAVAFTIFKVFSDFFDSKDTILLVTVNDELDWNGGLGHQQSKRRCFWGSRLAGYKMNAILYVKCSIEYRYLVLIRVSLRAANCVWPWLDTKKKVAYLGTVSPGAS